MGENGEILMEERFLSTLDVAKRLNKSPETIRIYERLGKLPAIRTIGSRMRIFRESDVLAFEREQNMDGLAT